MSTKRQTLLREINVLQPEALITKSIWEQISFVSKLSEEFIREFKNEVSWYLISAHQNLSEDFIREFKEKVHWSAISRKRKLSADFIHEFNDLIKWESYFFNQESPFDIMKTFIQRTSYTKIGQFKSNHLSEPERNEIVKILRFKYLFKKEKAI